MKANVKELTTEQLHENIVSQSQIIDLLTNGMFPGGVNQLVGNGLIYMDRLRNQFVEEFVARPDAKQKFPESFQEPQQPQGKGVQGIQGA